MNVDAKMKLQIHRNLVRLLIFCLSFVVLGCQALAPRNTQPANSSLVPTTTRTPRSVPATITPSAVPPEATGTGTPSPTITASLMPTPVATLPLADAQALIEDLLDDNAGCQLPCWWGFTPGHTLWQEAYPYLATFDAHIYVLNTPAGTPYYAEVTIPVPEHIYPTYTRQKYTLRAGVIELIEVIPGYVAAYSLAQILDSYGQPTEVWLRTYSRALSGDLPFDMVLFYPEQGILARFAGQGTVISNLVRSCPPPVQAPVLALWSPGPTQTFVEAANQTINIRNEESWPYRRLDEVTDINVETFYRTFLDQAANPCLQTAVSFWAEP